jgi:hypothetical protein
MEKGKRERIFGVLGFRKGTKQNGNSNLNLNSNNQNNAPACMQHLNPIFY